MMQFKNIPTNKHFRHFNLFTANQSAFKRQGISYINAGIVRLMSRTGHAYLAVRKYLSVGHNNEI